MRMPAVDVGFGYFLGANETDFAEFIQEFDKGALLVDVAPDLKKFLADDFEFLAFLWRRVSVAKTTPYLRSLQTCKAWLICFCR